MVSLRGASDINVSVKKATTAEASVPKRKHVRACVVYTWDNRNGRDFWNAIKLQPLQNSDIQTFKALVVIHKVMQEGHPKVIKEGQNNVNWLRSLARNGSYGGTGQYNRLIEEYVRLLTHKLDFHKAHPAFNGTFEYAEYISLRQVDDPNEGYEAIIDLLNLQDAIDDFQRLVFGSLRGRHGNEVKISSLTAIVAESYGIYRFATSMLRGMYAAGQADDALEPLRQRYYTQHRRLRNFYFDCTTLKPLTALISIPQLPEDPPNLFLTDDDAPPLPRRPIEASKTGESSATSLAPEPTGDWYLQQQAQQQQLEEQQRQQMLLQQQQQMAQQQQYEEEQRRLQAAREAEEARQRQLAYEQQQMFEQQQAQLLAQQQAAQEEFLRSQQQRNAEGRVAELEQQLFAMRGQQEEAQMMLQQYDQRVQTLENELSQSNSLTEQQLQSKTDQVEALHEQVNVWKSKYESLAKLYSQLRQEHLDLLSKFKKTQAKAASAQEAIDKREKIERDLKAKNLELADLIRERDRARYDLDRLKGQHRDETDRLERDLSLLNDKLSKTQLSGSERASLLDSHSKEIQLLEAKLADAQRLLANASTSGDQDREIHYLKETIEAMEHELSKSVVASGGNLLDEVLKSASESIKDGLSMFHSPIETGNQGTTVQYIETIVQRCWESVDDFSAGFTDYLSAQVEGEGDATPIVGATLNLSNGIVELLANVKGVSAMLPDDSEKVTQPTESAAETTSEFFETMLSSVLAELTVDDQLELIIESHTDILQQLQQLLEAVLSSQPKQSKETNPESAMERAALAAEEANRKLTELLARPRDPKLSVFDKHVHEAIIAAAVAITSAIAALIKAASECQKDIVAKGRGTDSATVYYKKNHRWTQGLISAAHAVADSTNTLIDTADGSLTGQNSPEQLIVASNEVAASTAQLVAAARVKADHGSRTQQNLETASKSVGSACRSLVNRVQEILSSREVKEAQTNFKTLPEHEFRTAAMSQQVEVLKLERQLTAARNRLFEIRREEYRRQGDEEDDDEY
ncbi:Endocytosis protein end4 [Wickerhamiella sorbophila]|uniref:Endocytosis protein end4 n=1 Tax=Wickerhamiella sorbophila TaxID=45607 RepID=A0A2T0FL77_9ASCO|nr:Endocytosis protein end4 [Wickerhamiella sorbophila]PRT55748.1 Endocytosis protein end4 [Wickerhamiella sorbophila]